MVWRIIFLLLIFYNNYFVNSFSPLGLNPQIFEPSVKYQQEHRPVISKDGSSDIPKSPYESPSPIFATRPPLPGYYKATMPFTRGPFPYVPVTESPIKIKLKNPQDLLQEVQSNGYYDGNEFKNKKVEKIVSNTGLFYPIQKTINGDMIGYVNVPYYEIPTTQSVKSQKIVILDQPSTTTMTTTTTLITTTKRSTIIEVKNTTITKNIDIPEIFKNKQSKLVTTSHLPTTQSILQSYPAVDISKHNNTPIKKTSIQLQEENKYNYQKNILNTHKYPNSTPKINGYEAIPISPQLYNNIFNGYNLNYNNLLQPSPPMTGGYYEPQPSVTKKKTKNLVPIFTKTKSHLVTINPSIEKNINSIVSNIKNKKTTISSTIPTTTITRSSKTKEYKNNQTPNFNKITQLPSLIVSSTKKPHITSSIKDVKFEETYFTISPKKSKVTHSTKNYSSNLLFLTSQLPQTIVSSITTSTTKPQIVTFPTITKNFTFIPSVNKTTTPSIVIFQKSTKTPVQTRPTSGISSTNILPTTPSTKKVEQTVTFEETKILDKEETTNVKNMVKFEHETNISPKIKTSTTEPTFEKESIVNTKKFESYKNYSQPIELLKTVTPTYTKIQIEPSIFEDEENEQMTLKKNNKKINVNSLSSIKPITVTESTYAEKPELIFEGSTLSSRPEVITYKTPSKILQSTKKNLSEYNLFSETISTIPSKIKIEHTTIPFIPESKILEKFTTQKPFEELPTTQKTAENISTTKEEFIESLATKEITKKPLISKQTSFETTKMMKPSLETSIIQNIETTPSTITSKGIESSTLETTILTIPQQHSESLFPEISGFEETTVVSMKPTEKIQIIEEMTTENTETTKSDTYKVIETTSIPTVHVKSTTLPEEIIQTTTLFSTMSQETGPFSLETLTSATEIPTQTMHEIEASTHASTTVETKIISTQPTEVEIVPFSPTEGLFASNQTTESTTQEKVIVDFDSAKVTKNLTELCSTTQSVIINETEILPSKEIEIQSTKFAFTPTELSEETSTIPIEILFPTISTANETLKTEETPTIYKNLTESVKVLEFTTIQPITTQEIENETATTMTTFYEEKETTTPSIISTLSIEMSTLGKTTTEEEIFPTEFSFEEATAKTTIEKVPFFILNATTTEEPKTKLIKSIVIIDGKKKITVLKAPETPGIEFISPNMTITKILNKSTKKLVPNGKTTAKNNLLSIQVTTDMEKSVKLEDVDFEKALEKELDEMIPKILETLDKEVKESKDLGEKLEKDIEKELEKEIKNNDDIGKQSIEEFSKKNVEKSFIDRDYPDFDPSKDKVFDSNIFKNNDIKIQSCSYESFVFSEPPTDIMFMIDGTTSMSGDNFIHSLKLMSDFVMKFNNIGPNGTQFSLVQYTSQPFFEFSFKKHICRDDIIKDIIETSYMKGNNSTNNLDIALDKINKFGFSYLRGDRPEAKNFLIIFNGNEQKNSNIVSAIEELKRNDIEIFAICDDEDSQTIFQDILPQNNIMSLKNDIIVDKITQDIKKIGNKKNNDIKINMIKIDCIDNELRVVLEVPKSYQGIFTTKNYFNDSTCSRKIPMEIGDGYKQLGFIFKNNNCGLDIIQNDKLNGKNYSIVMNIFKDDKVNNKDVTNYLVQCFSSNKNNETDKKNSISNDVIIDMVPPTCQYSLHRDSINGPIVNLAVVGQTIYHKWECHGRKKVENYYKMFIHNCFIGTYGKKKIFKMVDDNGCSTKNATIDTINYENDKMIAYAKSQVFSLEDIEHMKFSCKIGLCLKNHNNCDKITPPECNSTEGNNKSTFLRHDRQINLINLSLENDVETILQIIESFRFGSQKLINNNDIFNYKDLEEPVIPIMLITLIIALSIFIIITVYKKYKHPLNTMNDDIFSKSYTSNIINNSSINNSNKLNIDNINFEDKTLHHKDYTLINFHKNSVNI